MDIQAIKKLPTWRVDYAAESNKPLPHIRVVQFRSPLALTAAQAETLAVKLAGCIVLDVYAAPGTASLPVAELHYIAQEGVLHV